MTTSNPMYTFGYVGGANASYFVYNTSDDAVSTRLVVDATGRLLFLTWVEEAKEWVLFWSEPRAQCDVYSLCGPFSVCTENALSCCSCLRGFSEQYQGQWSQGDHTQGGCRRNVALQISSSNGSPRDRFYTKVDVKLPSNAQNSTVAAAAAAAGTQSVSLHVYATVSALLIPSTAAAHFGTGTLSTYKI